MPSRGVNKAIPRAMGAACQQELRVLEQKTKPGLDALTWSYAARLGPEADGPAIARAIIRHFLFWPS
jgi:hypothetical protein